MVLKTYDTRDKPVIVTKPLTPKSFADFGDIISADHQIGLKEQSSANYGTAIKVHKVSKINNNSSKANSGVKAQANWNIFRCSPPLHLFQKNSNGETVYLSKVLERHPYSTQTFLPMGVDKEKDAYIVICAKSRAGEQTPGPRKKFLLISFTLEDSLPDPDTLEAFICKGNQAVTYGAGEYM